MWFFVVGHVVGTGWRHFRMSTDGVFGFLEILIQTKPNHPAHFLDLDSRQSAMALPSKRALPAKETALFKSLLVRLSRLAQPVTYLNLSTLAIIRDEAIQEGP